MSGPGADTGALAAVSHTVKQFARRHFVRHGGSPSVKTDHSQPDRAPGMGGGSPKQSPALTDIGERRPNRARVPAPCSSVSRLSYTEPRSDRLLIRKPPRVQATAHVRPGRGRHPEQVTAVYQRRRRRVAAAGIIGAERLLIDVLDRHAVDRARRRLDAPPKLRGVWTSRKSENFNAHDRPALSHLCGLRSDTACGEVESQKNHHRKPHQRP